MKTEAIDHKNAGHTAKAKGTELQLSEFLLKGEQFMSESNWDEAIAVYKKAVELDQHNISILGKLGFCYSRSGQHELSIKIFSDLCQRAPQDAKWPYMIGYQYYDKKDWKKAIQYFDKSLSLDGDYIKVLYRSSYARIQIDDIETAEKLLLKCINSWQKLDEGKKVGENSRYSDACFQLGKLYLNKRLTLKAEKWLKEAVSHGDRDEHKHYNLGKAFLGNKKITEALEEFKRANALHPRLDYFQDKLAYTYLQAGQFDQAEQIYQTIPPHKRKSYIWCNYGVTLLKRGKSEAAINALQNAVKQDYDNHRIHFYLGSAYLERENIPHALKELELAAKLKLKYFETEYKEAIEKIKMIHSQFGERITSSGSDASIGNEIGIIETFNSKRGFGFLKNKNGEKIFFHISAVSNPGEIFLGREANFVRVESEKGSKASEVSII
jgi:tetratricopeptide (TPR) repeat protein